MARFLLVLDVESDEDILDWVARDGETALHPSCTCKMGVGEMAVVDPNNMKVHTVCKACVWLTLLLCLM